MGDIVIKAKTGPDFEKEFFGVSSTLNGHNQPRYLTYENAVDKAVSQQPKHWDQHRPRTPLSLALFEAVRVNLPPEFQKKLQLFSALSTVLDCYHGVDGFFQCGSPWTTVAFDLSIVPHPAKTPNVEFVITKEIFETKLDELGSEIASRLLERIHRLEVLQTPTA